MARAQHAAETILWPAASKLLRKYPEVSLEVSVDSALTDIVASRFDAGIRLGEQVARDMVAVRIGPALRMAVVGAASYFATRPAPKTPHDLTQHACVNVRWQTLGGIDVWEFGKNGREMNIRVDGPLVFNSVSLVLKAVADGFGLACVMEDHVARLRH